MRQRRELSFTVRFSEQEWLALTRLADYDQRSMAAVLRVLVRADATQKGLWPVSRHIGLVKKAE